MNAGRNQEDSLDKLNNVFVKNIADASEEELRELFEPYGKITSLKVCREKGKINQEYETKIDSNCLHW